MFLLKAIETAPPTSTDSTPLAFVDESRQSVVAFFAIEDTAAISPGLMCAFMVLDQILCLPFNQPCPPLSVEMPSVSISVDDGISASVKSLLVPLLAYTCLPLQAACIAELGTAVAGSRTVQPNAR